MSNELINPSNEKTNLPAETDKVLTIDSKSRTSDYRNSLIRLVQYADMTNIVSSIQRTSQYVVDVPLQFQEAFNKGIIEINQNAKNGKLWPTLVRKLDNGKKEFVANLPIHQESMVQGNPMHELSTGIQMMQLQQQLADLTQLVKDVYEAVIRVEEGQRDDRVGLLKSGYEGVQHALLHDGDQRQAELIEARGQIREAKNQIGEVLKSRLAAFKPVHKNQIVRFGILMFDTQYDAKKDAEYHRIQDYFELYLRAVQLHAASFAAVNDTKLAEEIYSEAREFIASLDFSKLATIRNIHKNTPESDYFFPTALTTIEAEKAICLDEAKPYDYVEFSFTGDELLEVIEDGEKPISKEET